MPPTSNAAPGLGSFFDPLLPTGDKTTFLSTLTSVVTAVHRVGPAMIGGVDTTQYELTVSQHPVKAIIGAAIGASVGILDPLGMWVDSQQRVRQLRLSFTDPELGKETWTSDYSRFGIPVHITIPLANEVVTMQQLQQDICSALGSAADLGLGCDVASVPTVTVSRPGN